MVLSPEFYSQWLSHLINLINPAILFIAILGIAILTPKLRVMIIGLWSGYLVYGLMVPRLITTHDYYSIQTIPIAALSLLPIAEIIFHSASSQPRIWQLAVVSIFFFAMGFSLWTAASTLGAENYRDEVNYWQDLGNKLPDQINIIALTQQYGLPLNYYGWQQVDLWPVTRQLQVAEDRGVEKEFDALFNARSKNNALFLITSFTQLDQQPLLKHTLVQYPIYLKGGGFTVYDLREQP